MSHSVFGVIFFRLRNSLENIEFLDRIYLEPLNICFYPELEPFKSVDCELVKTYLVICRGYVDQCL